MVQQELLAGRMALNLSPADNYGMAKTVRTNFKPARRRTFFREWRKYRDYTLEDAAELSGMSVGNISAMERGAQNYTEEGLLRLAEAYRCEPAQLLMVDPTKDDAIWSIWEHAKVGDRQKIVEIARTIVGKTGTDR